MKLLKLTLQNFKGIKAFTFEPNGKNASIYGRNATGKTTIADAESWLLFGKDSTGAADFSIKPIDKGGQSVHNLETAVEGTFEIQGKTVTLRKVFSEKWTKKRGSAQPEFTGHTTDHYVDGVPVQKKEYDAAIAGIAREDVFKLLTSPVYFNEGLNWQDRRRILLEVCGDLTDEQVLDSYATLGNKTEVANLTNILNTRKLEDHRKIITARRAEINKELERIPVRISEVQQSLPDATEAPPEQEIARLRADRDAKQAELSRIENGGEIAEKTKALRQAEAGLLEIENEFRRGITKQTSDKQFIIDGLRGQIWELATRANPNLFNVEPLERKMEALRNKWEAVRTKEYAGASVCPTCEQPLPEEKIEEARANFNRQKAEDMERISAQGKELAATAKQQKEQNEEKTRQAADAKAEIAAIEAGIKEVEQEAAQLRAQDVMATEPWQTKDAAIAIIKRTVEGLRDGAADTGGIQSEIAALNDQIATLEKAAAAIDQRTKGEARIAELKAQEKDLAREFERLENELYLTDQFTRQKVKLLDERINSKFKHARFKMFQEQINGGIEPCCETLYGGVPYGSGLNNGHRIVVGLDIIATLSEHYGFSAPIIVDNAESITEMPEMSAQIISLVHSRPDKTLRVEVDN